MVYLCGRRIGPRSAVLPSLALQEVGAGVCAPAATERECSRYLGDANLAPCIGESNGLFFCLPGRIRLLRADLLVRCGQANRMPASRSPAAWLERRSDIG